MPNLQSKFSSKASSLPSTKALDLQSSKGIQNLQAMYTTPKILKHDDSRRYSMNTRYQEIVNSVCLS